MSNCSSLYRDVYNAADCYEFATVGEMNGVTGAVPIPATTAQRIFDTKIGVDAQGRTQSQQVAQVAQVAQATGVAPAAVANVAAAAGVSPAAVANFIRMNRGF
jgi:hypothetical protein